MKIYVVMVNDRHTDPEPYVFSTAERAIEYARQATQEYAHGPEDIDETLPPPAGWLYSASYSVEDDSVWVIEKELDGD